MSRGACIRVVELHAPEIEGSHVLLLSVEVRPEPGVSLQGPCEWAEGSWCVARAAGAGSTEGVRGHVTGVPEACLIATAGLQVSRTTDMHDVAPVAEDIDASARWRRRSIIASKDVSCDRGVGADRPTRRRARAPPRDVRDRSPTARATVLPICQYVAQIRIATMRVVSSASPRSASAAPARKWSLSSRSAGASRSARDREQTQRRTARRSPSRPLVIMSPQLMLSHGRRCMPAAC